MQINKNRFSLVLFSLIATHVAYADLRPTADHAFHLVGEFVYMKRSSIHNKALVKDTDKHVNTCGCPSKEVIDNKDLVDRMGFEPGFRVAAIFSLNRRSSYELNFLYLQPWHAQKQKKGDGSLKFPFSSNDYTDDFYQADKATGDYSMHFWSVELNDWRHFTPRFADYFSLSGLAGLRYFHWNERFELIMVKPPDKSDYATHTKNDVFGLQLGLNLQWNPTRWITWELTGKVGGMVNHAKQKTFLGDDDNSVVLRDFHQQKWTLGVFADTIALLSFQFKEHFDLHVGYQAIFFSGLALAPEQVSKKTNFSAGKRVYLNGTAVVQGIFTGLTLSF